MITSIDDKINCTSALALARARRGGRLCRERVWFWGACPAGPAGTPTRARANNQTRGGGGGARALGRAGVALSGGLGPLVAAVKGRKGVPSDAPRMGCPGGRNQVHVFQSLRVSVSWSCVPSDAYMPRVWAACAALLDEGGGRIRGPVTEPLSRSLSRSPSIQANESASGPGRAG